MTGFPHYDKGKSPEMDVHELSRERRV